MSLHPARLLARPFGEVSQTYAESDTMLYALALGLGTDPLDAGQLRYVFERVPGGLQVLPTLANVLGYCGFWADQPDTGITWQKLVHAEQSLVLHRPLSAAGHVVGINRVVGLHDKGAGKGALMLQQRCLMDAGSGSHLATVTQTTMLRADGGFAAEHGAAHGQLPDAPHRPPARAPDAVCDLPTLPQAALLYRLNGDGNPLHADPDVARAAGFERPLLHGLATMGVALHAVLKTMLGYDAGSVRAMRVRFTAPVLPGETLRTEIWREGGIVSLRSTVRERAALVLDAGRVELG